MLSSGKWHKHVPKDPIANVRWRKELYEKCAEDPDFQGGVEEICRQDIVFWIDAFAWQFNPKKKGLGAVGPFICWDFQEEALLDRPETTGRYGIVWAYEKNKTCVVEKSRDMGVSWLFLLFQDWLCLFQDNVQCLDISRSEKAVDHKSPDSLFWKIRRIHEWLPSWMKGRILEQELLFNYKKTGGYITGEASTGKAGVGGRASVIFVDEFSQIRDDRQVRQRTANTADCRFFNGTHVGTGSEFYKLTQTPEICKITMHWTRHPEKNQGLYRWNVAKNQADVFDKTYQYPEGFKFDTTGKPFGGPFPGIRSPWYDEKCSGIGNDRAIAEDLDINPTGSVSQFFEPRVIQEMSLKYACPPTWIGRIVKDGKSYKMVEDPPGTSEKDAGPLKLWFAPDSKGRPPPAVYVIGGDVSWGLGSTNSCFTLFNADIGERVGEYVDSWIYPQDLAPMMVWLAKQCLTENGETAQMVWEIPGPGLAFGKEVMGLGYRNIWWNRNDLQFLGKPQRKNPGWMSEAKSKVILLDDYRVALRTNDFLNRSALALEECLLFQLSDDGRTVFHTGSLECEDPSGAGVNHGDRTMGDALAWKIAKDHAKRTRDKKEVEDEAPLLSLQWRRNWRAQRDQEEELYR